MHWYIRGEDQGQTVETSYAYDSEGGAYKRVHDRTDGTTSYYHGSLDWTEEPEHENHERVPCVDDWRPCEAPGE